MAVLTDEGEDAVTTTLVFTTTSTDPMVQRPLPPDATPRWSVREHNWYDDAVTPVLAGKVTVVLAGIAATAGLDEDGSTVCVGPPLLANAAREALIVGDEFTLVD